MLDKIKEFKMSIGVIVVILPMIAGSAFWFINNVVFAAEFDRYRLEDSIRWSNYDEQRLRSEYYDLRGLPSKLPRDKKRLMEVESKLDHVVANRLALEKELRASERIKVKGN